MRLICEGEIVTDKDFLYNYTLEKWQLNKMKDFGKDQGWFKYKGYTFELQGYAQKHVETNSIQDGEMPFITIKKLQGRIKLIFTDQEYREVRAIKKGFKIHIRYKHYTFTMEQFCNGVGMNADTLKGKLAGVDKCKLNGEWIKVVVKPKNSIFYTIIDNKQKKTYKNVVLDAALAFLGCKRCVVTNLNKYYQSTNYGDFTIERHSGKR